MLQQLVGQMLREGNGTGEARGDHVEDVQGAAFGLQEKVIGQLPASVHDLS